MYEKIQISIALLFSKLAVVALRFCGLGGTTLPGRIALFFKEDILSHFSTKLDKVILVTGTNGKTTTCKIIGKILNEAGIIYFTNHSGANLKSGIVSTLIHNADLRGNFKVKTALFEIDEAAISKITSSLNPDYIVLTNFFRDQLDRYGELYTTVRNVQNGVENSASPLLIVNADDSLTSSISKNTGKNTIYFGFCETSAQNSEMSSNTDSPFCIYCKTRYEYNFITFGHLGDFHCPSCGYSRTKPQIICENIKNLTSSYSDISIAFPDSGSGLGDRTKPDDNTVPNSRIEKGSCRINLPGLYNIYNSLAAASLGYAMGIPHDKIFNALETFECGFGRMETIETSNKFIKIILVKNPAGFNQVINFLLTEDKNAVISFILNDNIADSTDISWIWDVDFEKLERIQNNVSSFITSGKRACDMSVRLKYAGIFKNKISTCLDYDTLINTGLSKIQTGENFYILPTYTAMLEIRKFLSKKFTLKEFWK